MALNAELGHLDYLEMQRNAHDRDVDVFSQ
jgi:hypothetical protein